MPLELIINTHRELYELRAGMILRTGVEAENDSIGIYIRLLGWKKYISLIPPEPLKKRKKEKLLKKEKKKNKRRIKNLPKRAIAVLKSFRVKQLEVNIDTGNYVTNAYLYPVFYMLKRGTGKNIAINFSGENHLVLHVQNNLWRIGWAFVIAR